MPCILPEDADCDVNPIDGIDLSLHSVAAMAPRTSEAQTPSDDIAELTSAVRELAEQVEVLRNVLDEMRDQLSWALRNDAFSDGLPRPSVLKRMAADPTASDWAERLEILRPMTSVEASVERPSTSTETVDVAHSAADSECEIDKNAEKRLHPGASVQKRGKTQPRLF